MIDFNTGSGTTGLNQSGGLCTGKGVGTPGPHHAVARRSWSPRERSCATASAATPRGSRTCTASAPAACSAGATTWQVVAKGIEDMQVQYRTLDPVTMAPAANWLNEPPQVVGCDPANPAANCCDPGCIPPNCLQPLGCTQPTNAGLARLVTELRVTLTARSEAHNIAGATTSVAGGDRIRGSLTQTISPRSTLYALSRRPVAWPAARSGVEPFPGRRPQQRAR